MRTFPKISRMGERSVLLQFEPEIRENVLKKVLAAREMLQDKLVKEEVEIATTYNSLLVTYPITIEYSYSEFLKLQEEISQANVQFNLESRLFHIPVCYDDKFALDLQEISEAKNLSKEEIIRLHSSTEYTVYFTGFLPGFLYLGGLPKELHFPRRKQPRLEVQKGAVGIGEKQTGIYPQRSPGGWNIIGNSPVPLFDPEADPPCGIKAGDKIKFFEVSPEEHQDILAKVEKVDYVPKREKYIAKVEVLQPGLFSSIQDEGRFGYRKYGVPISGAMDQQAAAMANLLLQNEPNAAVLEITLQGPVLKFSESTQITITGAYLSPMLDEVQLENNHPYNVEAGQVLRFGRRSLGFRAYLAIKGGFRTLEILKSRSWCKGITPHYRLEKGMEMPYFSSKPSASEKYSAVKSDNHLTSEVVEAYPGPEYELLSASEKKELQKMHFSAGKDSDRMGIQFQEKFQNSLEPIITGPVLPGTVQLTPSGTLITLMRDCQTTGGYPRILQISENGMNILSQKLPGEKLQIKLINYR